MLELMKDFEMAAEDLVRLQDAIKQALALPLEPGVRQHLQELDRSISEGMAETRNVLPQAEAELQKEAAAIQASVEQANREIAAVEQDVARLEAEQAAARPTAVEPGPDPGPIAVVRKELLERFASPTRPAAPPVLDAGDVASMVSGEFRTTELPSPNVPSGSAHLTTPPPPSRPPTKEARKTNVDEDVGDMTSGSWSTDD